MTKPSIRERRRDELKIGGTFAVLETGSPTQFGVTIYRVTVIDLTGNLEDNFQCNVRAEDFGCICKFDVSCSSAVFSILYETMSIYFFYLFLSFYNVF